ncbi:hypothetical protein N6N79_23590, partial [Escherichia albertii]|uniref:phage tail tube protein n=1 Tax=Escherichia albertii TaxID=208962 RepID=UPI002948BDC9
MKNDGHYFCRAGGNRPDGLNEPVTVKGAGTTLWVYKGNGDPYANPLSDVDWLRLAKVKDL